MSVTCNISSIQVIKKRRQHQIQSSQRPLLDWRSSMPPPCSHLVDAKHRCAKLLTQAMQRRRHRQHLFGPLHPISRLELAPEQSRQRVDH